VGWWDSIRVVESLSRWCYALAVILGVIAAGFGVLRWFASSRLDELKANQFLVVDSKSLGGPTDDLRGLAWEDGTPWVCGKLGATRGFFHFATDFTQLLSTIDTGAFVYACTIRDRLIIGIVEDGVGGYAIQQYDLSGRKLSTRKLPFSVDPSGAPGFLIWDGANYWAGVDNANVVYKLDGNFVVTGRTEVGHRLLGAMLARRFLWITDAYKVYQYDLDLRVRANYRYTGTSCRGMSFHADHLWTLDAGPKRVLKHAFY
jgi:hypothetical protein